MVELVATLGQGVFATYQEWYVASRQRIGADAVVNAAAENAVEAGNRVTRGSAHGVLVTAQSVSAFR